MSIRIIGAARQIGAVAFLARLVVVAFAVSLTVAAVTLPVAVRAEETTPEAQASVAQLARIMQMDQVIAVMRDEGLNYADTLEKDMFPGRGGADWRASVEAIYNADELQAEFLTAMTASLEQGDGLDRMVEFMSSDLGQKIIGSELAARRALLQPDLEDAARMIWLDLEDEGGRRVRQIEDFITVNDLMDSNVTGTMNSNLAFFRQLEAVLPQDMAMTEEDILASVAAQEGEIRAQTADWLYSYAALAYQPLSDDEFQRYVDFSDSAAGRQLNAALFQSFAKMMDRISGQLGHEAGLVLRGENI